MMALMTGALAISELDDLRDLAGMAVARVAQSISEGCARDACTWMRVYERLQRHVARLEEAAPPEQPAPAVENAPGEIQPDAAAASSASDSSDSSDRVFFDAVLSSWPSGVPQPGTARRQTGLAP
jgi:hypothetical protein